MKPINKALVIGFFALNSLNYAIAGSFFNVNATGTPAEVDIVLCLNGKASLTCQKYHVIGEYLEISTVTQRYYPNAGIQILTAGYGVAGCTPDQNGYCLFATSNTSPALLQLYVA